MEIFVSDKEIPKNCEVCPCINQEGGFCNIDGYCNLGNYESRPQDCPFKSLEQHDRELLEDIQNEIGKMNARTGNCDFALTKLFNYIEELKGGAE